MKLWTLIGLFSFGLALPSLADPTLPERYLALYVKINEAEQLERHSDYKGALATFQDCYQELIEIHDIDPDWEAALVAHRIEDVKAKILEMETKVNPPAPDFTFAPISFGPHNNYPWKTNITTTIFWIGEAGATSSAWDPNWVRENDGPDNPYKRNGYAAGAHASGLNPFYIALPFNDLTHPDLAQKWLPPGWHREPKNGAPVSSCKDRWVEIKNALGDVCYAQWEDVGPGRNDHAGYVFGTEPPGKDNTPGMCLSPAVADYLRLGGDQPATVSWRFVDIDNVRPGAWLKLDEQAVLYRAMHRLQASR